MNQSCSRGPVLEQIKTLTRAIEEAERVGVPMGMDVKEIGDARQLLAKLRQRQELRSQEALCALLAALDAQKDDSFGDVAHEALAGALDAQQAEGGASAIAAVKEA